MGIQRRSTFRRWAQTTRWFWTSSSPITPSPAMLLYGMFVIIIVYLTCWSVTVLFHDQLCFCMIFMVLIVRSKFAKMIISKNSLFLIKFMERSWIFVVCCYFFFNFYFKKEQTSWNLHCKLWTRGCQTK